MREGWEIKKLGEICDFQRGLTYSKKDEIEYSNNCVLRSNNINLDTMSIIFDELKYINEDFVIGEDKKVKPNTILICMSNGSKQHIGKVAFIDKDYGYAFGGFMGLIKPKNAVYPKFVYYSFLTSSYKHFLAEIGNGANITNLKFSDLSQYKLYTPPLSEQEKIVVELDCLSGIIEKKKQQLKELDSLAQSIFYEMFGDPVENEKGWEVKKFKDCYKLTSGKNLTAKQIVDGDYPVYGGNGIVGYHNDYNLDGDNIIIGRVGALCGNVRNVLGKSFITDNAFILTKLEIGINVFVLYLLSIHDLRQYARDALQPVISNAGFQNIEIILPPLSLQQQFANKIELIEKQKELIKQSIKETETLFDSRMDYYFNS